MSSEKLSYNDMAQIPNALDTNGDNEIDREEYGVLIKEAEIFEDEFEDVGMGD